MNADRKRKLQRRELAAKGWRIECEELYDGMDAWGPMLSEQYNIFNPQGALAAIRFTAVDAHKTAVALMREADKARDE